MRWLRELNISQRLLNNTLSNGLRLVVNLGVAFLLTPFLVRSLGREVYGIWVLALAFSATGYFSLLDLGLQSAVVKYVAEYQVRGDEKGLNRITGSSLLLHLSVGVLASGAIAVIAQFFLLSWFHVSPEQAAIMRPLLWLFAVQTLFEFPALTVAGVLEGVQAYVVLRVIEIARGVLFAGGCVILLSLGHSILAMSGLSVALAIAAVFARFVAMRRLAPRVRPALGLDRDATRTMLRFSGMVFANRILGTFYYQMDKTIVVVMLPVVFLTDLDIVMKLQGAAAMATTLISPNITPMASALEASGRRPELKSLLLTGSRYEAIISLPVTITLAALAGPFIHYWVGAQYAHNGALARLILIEAAVVPLAGTGYNIMVGIGRVGALVRILGIGTTINLLISVALVPIVGMSGVLWGTVIANVLMIHPMYLVLMRRELGMSWRELIGPTLGRIYPMAALFAALSFALVSWIEPANMLVVLALGALLTAVGLAWLILTGLDRDEWHKLVTALRTFRFASALATTTGLDHEPRTPS